MSRHQKLLEYILLGEGDSNIAFSELRGLLTRLGFDERIRGSNHIFTMKGVEEIVNLQPLGNKAKDYQVRQIRDIILDYKLTLED